MTQRPTPPTTTARLWYWQLREALDLWSEQAGALDFDGLEELGSQIRLALDKPSATPKASHSAQALSLWAYLQALPTTTPPPAG